MKESDRMLRLSALRLNTWQGDPVDAPEHPTNHNEVIVNRSLPLHGAKVFRAHDAQGYSEWRTLHGIC